jgi:tripartite-type tricarboxylate transporter receptor subunit TctC
MKKRLCYLIGLLVSFGLCFPGSGRALDFPTKPIQMVVGMSPGGPADTSARIIAEEASKELGVPVVVVNKPGASGSISASLVARAKPDGYTILVGMTGSLSVAWALNPDVPYKLSDFAPISRHTIFPLVIAVKAESPWKTFKEFIEDAQKNPGKFKSGSDGGGTSLDWEYLLKNLNLDVKHVLYKGASPNFTALLGGHIDISAIASTPILPQLEAKKMRLLACSSRMKEFPDTPTLSELGYPEASRDFWNGFLAPANTPQAIVEKLSEVFQKALNKPSVQEQLMKIGVNPSFQGPKEFGEFLQKEYEIYTRWGQQYKISE